MQQSLNHFWGTIIHPILTAVHARHVVEIGCADGINTTDLLAYCKEYNGHLDVIDPSPDVCVEEWTKQHAPYLDFHQDLSVNILPKLQRYDAVLIDGDHNWYTVYHELKLIEKAVQEKRHFPVIILHDTGWPYAQRDMYCNPATIPDAYRKNYVQKGILPGIGMPLEHDGFNEHCLHAIEEHNYRNGVKTALEDFIEESPSQYVHKEIPGFFGISILVSQQKITEYPALETLLNNLQLSKPIFSHVEALEHSRIYLQIAYDYDQKCLVQKQKELEQVQDVLDHLQIAYDYDQKCLVQKQKELEQVQDVLDQKNAKLGNTYNALAEKNIDLNKMIDALEQKHLELIEKNTELGNVYDVIEQKNTELGNVYDVIEQKNTELGNLHDYLVQKNTELDHIHNAVKQQHAAFVNMRSRLSWKLMAPLRSIEKCFEKRKSLHANVQHSPGRIVTKSTHENSLTVVGCTIISKNFLAQARVLAKSFLEYHPKGQFFVLVVDRLETEFSPEDEPFTVIMIDEIPVPSRLQIYFQYTCRELNTAVKPTFLRWLFETYNLQTLMYIDPDIQIFAPLESVNNALRHSSIVLTPHILQPINDTAVCPTEVDTLRVGAYNLGFIALRNTETSQRMLRWWEDRLIDHCFEKPEEGLFFDQKWIDLVPSLFGDTAILTDDTLNVAYWNLQERDIGMSNNSFTVNGTPLTFFHFSGYRPEEPDKICLYHHSNHTFKNNPGLQALFAQYRERLCVEGYESCIQWPYAFSSFENGETITKEMRRCFHNLGKKRASFINPFSLGENSCFFDWLNRCHTEISAQTYLSNLQVFLRDSRTDLRAAFPTLTGESGIQFALWLLEPAQKNFYMLPDVFLTSLQGASLLCNNPKDPLILRLLRRRNSMYLYRTSVAIAKKILPTSLCDISRNTLQMLSAPHRTTTEILKTTQRNHGQFGVNYFGYFSSENGVGQAARLMKEAAVIANIPVSTSNFTVSNAWQNTVLHDGHHDEKLPYDVNLIHINADQVPVFLEQHGKDHMHNNQNIGFWAWELSQFPKRWHDNFAYFDEIWTPSTFTTQAIAEFSPIPVITVPHPITISEADPHMREALGIPQDQTVFLFIFDYMSIFQRKNPIAVIEAFCRAFQDNENVTLIIKAAHPEADIPASKRMEHYVKSHPSIRLIQDRYSMAQIHGLIHACSAYVSLHRSEGFGLTIAEAMAMGKPVIATDYSGNTDYMNTNNSFPVRYTLIEIAEKCGPYEPGNVWAQPEIGHAAELMRYVYEHPDHATLIGKRAAQDVANNLSPERIGTLMLQRLAIKYTAILS